LLKVNPDRIRGGHYHTRKEEWFCCIQGRCVLKMVNVKDGSTRSVVLSESDKEFVLVKPYESHTVENFYEKPKVCELLVIVSEPYNLEDPDTFRYGDEK
jgi:UDP-2-acetamido-2,6-beta-L-arabino-hexul-4-ose reductase